MLLASEERRQIARLFNFLLQGEQLAFDCATRQAQLFQQTAASRFLLSQARQEATHVRIFKAGIGILAPRGVGEPLGKVAMARYRSLLGSALDKGEQAESLLGMQIILEGLGDIALHRISAGIPARGLAFHRVRQLLVVQEDAHHRFGLRQFQNLMALQPDEADTIYRRAEDYLALAEELVCSIRPLFEYFDEDPRDYISELQRSIPQKPSLTVT